MATTPQFSGTPRVSWVNGITAANTAKDGTGVVSEVFVAGASGSYLQKAIVRPRGTNVASVLRLFLNNGGSNAVAANNVLIAEVGLVATTNSEIAAITGAEAPFNFAIDPGYKVLATLGTAVAGGWSVTVLGGDY